MALKKVWILDEKSIHAERSKRFNKVPTYDYPVS